MKLALLGQHITHSLSPQLQALNARSYGTDLCFDLLDFNKSEWTQFFQKKEWCSYQGLNVTTPYKEIAYQACDHLSRVAQCLGAVNTLKEEAGDLHGHNTDVDGVRFLLEQFVPKINTQNTQVVILGIGGASRASAYALYTLGIKKIVWISRDRQRALDCLEWCRYHFPDLQATWLGPNGELIGAKLSLPTNQLLISGTPPLSKETWLNLALNHQNQLGPNFGLNQTATFIDLNYSRSRTQGSRAYSQHINLSYLDGLAMLVGQGISSFQWWTGFRAPTLEIYEQLQDKNSTP